MKQESIAVIFHRIGPYHRARLEAASRLTSVVAIELSADTSEYGWQPEYLSSTIERHVVCPEGDSRSLSKRELKQRLYSTLSRISPMVVAINGWSDTGALLALDWCVENQVPSICMSESNRHDEPRRFLKEAVKKQIVGFFSSGLVGGTKARQYLIELGVDAKRIFDGYDVVDNGHFQRPDGVSDERVRRELGLVSPYFLVSSRFIAKKNLPAVLEAYSLYLQRYSQHDDTLCDLVFLGDGELKSRLISDAERLGIRDHVYFVGFQQYEHLPSYYWGAIALVHASTVEQWGLVVNEAMAARLPVILSNRCGSASDLVRCGENGFLFEPHDISRLAQCMSLLANDTELRSMMGKKSAERIADWGCDRFATGMLAAAQAALGAKRNRHFVSRAILKALCL